MDEPLAMINVIVILCLSFFLDKNFGEIEKRLSKLERKDDDQDN